jgi:hypothetical protein
LTAAAHDREDLVSVAPRVRQPFQHQHTDALAPAAPSAASANGLQRPWTPRPRCRVKSMKVSGDAMTVTPPANASVALPTAQRLRGQVQCHQRRRARRVHRDGRTLKPKV